MEDNRIFINPLTITPDQLPIVVLVDDLQGFLGFVIKTHESGNYNHAMIMINPGKVVSQNNVLKEIPIDGYLNNTKMLKFWSIKNLSDADKQIMVSQIYKDLAKPWWGRMYDYVGLLGQALWMPWLQAPWLKYCSEYVASVMRLVSRFGWVPTEPSPSDLDAQFKQHPDDINSIGYWWPA